MFNVEESLKATASGASPSVTLGAKDPTGVDAASLEAMVGEFANELLAFRDSARELRQSPALGDTPLVVITRGRMEGKIDERRILMEKLWLEMQSELAGESLRSAHLVANDAGHNIHRGLGDSGVGSGVGDDLNQRQQVDRIEGVGYQDLRRVC